MKKYTSGLLSAQRRGIEQGAREAKFESARNFIKMGLSVAQVSQGTGLSEEDIVKLKES